MLTGKGAWIWQLDETLGGDHWAITSAASHAGLSHVTVRVSLGTQPENDGDHLRRLATALHSQGIQVWAWAYLYGKTVAHARAEGLLLGQRAAGMGADGAIMDVEGEYEAAGSADWAKANCQGVRAAFTGPLALSSFWKPSVHQALPWHTFIALCDLFMPQCYWGDCDTGKVWIEPAKLLQQTVKEYANYKRIYGKPLFPTGAIARKESGGDPARVRAFCREVDAQRLAGANFWDWQESSEETWAAMAAWKPKGGK